MKADKNFDFYEFAGIVMPGAVFLFGLTLSVPAIAGVVTLKDMTLGSFGVFLVLSYAAGHLVQAIGNVIEAVWWKYAGMPTDWIRKNRWPLVSPLQRELLEQRVTSTFGLKSKFKYEQVDQKAWFGMTRQMYAAVAAAKRAERIDTFNGNYGLNRGLAAGLICVACVLLARSLDNWQYSAFLLGGSVLALYRMHRFARHYARELLVQFLELSSSPGKEMAGVATEKNEEQGLNGKIE